MCQAGQHTVSAQGDGHPRNLLNPLPLSTPSMLALLSPSLVSLEFVYTHSCTAFSHISVLTSHHALVAIRQTQLVKPYRVGSYPTSPLSPQVARVKIWTAYYTLSIGRTACAKESISCQCQWGNPGRSRSRCDSGVSEHNQSFYRLLPSAEECCPPLTLGIDIHINIRAIPDFPSPIGALCRGV
jgi:hypothetical protein